MERPLPAVSQRTAGHGPDPLDLQAWLGSAPSFEGSWWTRWHEWLDQHSTEQVKARAVAGLLEHGAPVPAPGSYVHQG